jgi:hypothetical protein
MSLARDTATKRFPVSAKHNRIYGEGFFALVSRCNPRQWSVYLFPTVEARREKIDQWELSYAGCRAIRGCNYDHEKVDLRPIAAAPTAKFPNHTAQYDLFNIAMKPMYEGSAKP